MQLPEKYKEIELRRFERRLFVGKLVAVVSSQRRAFARNVEVLLVFSGIVAYTPQRSVLSVSAQHNSEKLKCTGFNPPPPPGLAFQFTYSSMVCI